MDSILRPRGDETTVEEAEENKEEILKFFTLEPAQISRLFSELVKHKESFTAPRVADTLELKGPMVGSRASGIRETFLDIIHLYSAHEATVETITKELASIGCDQAKVEVFTTGLKDLDKDTKHAVDILDNISWAVDSYWHVFRLGYDLSYIEMAEFSRDPEKPSSTLLPVVVLQLVLQKDKGNDKEDYTKYIQVHVPITDIERLSRSFATIAEESREKVRKFKKEGNTKLFIPEG